MSLTLHIEWTVRSKRDTTEGSAKGPETYRRITLALASSLSSQIQLPKAHGWVASRSPLLALGFDLGSKGLLVCLERKGKGASPTSPISFPLL